MTTLRLRSTSHSRSQQYFRYQDELLEDASRRLLETDNLTKDEIRDFLNRQQVPSEESSSNDGTLAYHRRRQEIHELRKKLVTGHAFVDTKGRLLQNEQPFFTMPPLPPLNDDQQPPHRQQQRPTMNEEQRAANAIARAVARYPNNENLQLIRLPVPQPQPNPLTFRRILCAVLAVVLAFLCMLLHTLPITVSSSSSSKHESSSLLKIRDFEDHVIACGPNLTRSNGDCSDGVLLLPSPHSMIQRFIKADATAVQRVWEHFIAPETGVNVTWEIGKAGGVRGVHDEWISLSQVHQALRFAMNLTEHGHDHLEIHYDTHLLQQNLPTIVETLRDLLQGFHYRLNKATLEPVAFRLHASAPLTGNGARNHHGTALNRTVHRQWMSAASLRNHWVSHFSFPWPFRLLPALDTCNLLADSQVDSRFEYHTSVFLSASKRYEGGLTLFVDDNDLTFRKGRVQRGLAIEGALGRIVVNSGGLENKRCRLAVTAGVRSVLQIWWQNTPEKYCNEAKV